VSDEERPARVTEWLVTRVASSGDVRVQGQGEVPYSTCESDSSSVVHVIVALEEVVEVTATADIVGGVVSALDRVIAVAGSDCEEAFPAAS
jgi:hypothetical protein